MKDIKAINKTTIRKIISKIFYNSYEFFLIIAIFFSTFKTEFIFNNLKAEEDEFTTIAIHCQQMMIHIDFRIF